MSDELTIIAPRSIEEAEKLSGTLSKAQTLPDALRQKPADILATVLTGAELGLAPMQAIRGIQIIKGKPTLAADTMGALVKRRSDVCEYLVLRESSAEKAVYETKRKGDPSPTTMSFTIQDAQRAGLNGDNWRKFPAAMLRARCLSAISRAVYPDLCLGLYDPDELAPENTSAAAPVERDVTPRNEPVKAKPGPIEDAVVVEPTKPADVVQFEKPAPLKGKAVLDAIRQHALDSGLTEKDAGDWCRSKGLTKTANFCEADLAAFREWVAAVNAEPPPAAESDVPF